MNYKQINELVRSKFDEGENLIAEYKNGRIIISMKREINNPPKWAIELINTVKSIDARLSNVENDIKEMKNTPTMKNELNSQK